MQLTASQRTLVVRLADGHFHSGAALSRELALSRTAVWGLIHELGNLGLDIKALPGKGYRLSRPLDLLDREQILERLDTELRNELRVLELHDCIDSTNTRLGVLVQQGAPAGTVCVAEVQSDGRGRIGRRWVSPFAGGVCLSVLWYFDDASSLEGLSLAVGVAVMRALNAMGVTDAGLKWPNDILWQDRKLGGILLEVRGEAHGRYAVAIGIGLNVHIPPPAAKAIDQSWTDLETVTGGASPSRNGLIAGILNQLHPLLRSYPETRLGAYLDEWNQLHSWKERRVTLDQCTRSVQGKIVGVDDRGLLVLQLEDGTRQAFASGDVRVRLGES